ncbi:MAG TPA: fumarylacetoacetate hydrolase family protein [bacterium]|nr:fumarylacetoacetate hydrolase family protein [bacterium]
MRKQLKEKSARTGYIRNSSYIILSMFVLLSACSSRQTETDSREITEQLGPNEHLQTIADHLLQARRNQQFTRALALRYPNLDRESAYRIQLMTLESQEKAGESLAGWKMGGTRITEAGASPDPLFGYSLESQVYQSGERVSLGDLTTNEPMVEAEITVWIGEDLPGPGITREELLRAIDGISGGVEIISSRQRPASEDQPETETTAHLVADGISHGGAIFGDTRMAPDDIDFDTEEAWISIETEEKARGSASAIMGQTGNPIDAVLWLANALPKHGRHLRAGDFVLTGSLYENPTMEAGVNAAVSFTNLGSIQVRLIE